MHKYFRQFNYKERNEYEKKLYIYIGKQIAHYRKSQGLTQLQLAQKVNRSRTTISRIERGLYNQNIPLALLVDIATALHINVKDFFVD